MLTNFISIKLGKMNTAKVFFYLFLFSINYSTILNATEVFSVCERSTKIRSKILNALKISDCNLVTSDDLNKIKNLTLTLDTFEVYGTTNNSVLSQNDFEGLNNLESLNCSFLYCVHNGRIPRNLFKNITQLKTLRIIGFSDLQIDSRKKKFRVNPLVLESDVFYFLPNLVSLSISKFELEYLPKNIFKNQLNLEVLELTELALKNLPKDLFHVQSKLLDLNLSKNEIKKIPAGFFSELHNLEFLSISSNQITSLKKNDFNDLKKLKSLEVHANPITYVEKHFLSSINKILFPVVTNVSSPQSFRLRISFKDAKLKNFSKNAFTEMGLVNPIEISLGTYDSAKENDDGLIQMGNSSKLQIILQPIKSQIKEISLGIGSQMLSNSFFEGFNELEEISINTIHNKIIPRSWFDAISYNFRSFKIGYAMNVSSIEEDAFIRFSEGKKVTLNIENTAVLSRDVIEKVKFPDGFIVLINKVRYRR